MSQEMFAEAVQATKAGQRRRARDLFTRLLKTEPNNADYWVWMSATVDSEKEQVFCLQKALKIDPNSIAARRGLVVLGALTPDEAALPPLITLDDLTPIQPGGRPSSALGDFVARNRWALLGGVIVLAALIVGGVFLYNALRPKPVVVVAATPTRFPTFTPFVEATATDATAAANTTPGTPAPTRELCDPPDSPNPATPLAFYLCVTQTAVPMLVPTTSSAAQYESYQSLVREYRSALALGSTGDWTQVMNRVRTLEGDSNFPAEFTVPYFKAEAHRYLGQLSDAVASYRVAISRNANFTPAYLGRAVVRFRQGDANGGLDDLNAALRVDPNLVAAYVGRADFYSANGNFTRALDDLEQAAVLAPNDAATLARLAMVYADSGQVEQALGTAQQALNHDPAEALAYLARGRAYYELGQYAEAEEDLSLARPFVENLEALYPTLWRAQVIYYYGLGQAGVGEDEAALEAFDEAIRLRSTLPLAYLARGQLLQRTGDCERARPDFNAAIGQFQETDADNPRLAEAYLGNGLCLVELNRPDGAISNFQIALRTLAENFDANLGLGRAFVLNNQPAEALEQMEVALQVAVSEAERAQALYWRSRAFRLVGRRADEVADLQAVADLSEAPAELQPTVVARLTEIGPLPSATPTVTETSAVTATRTSTARPATTGTPTRTPTAAADGSATLTSTPAATARTATRTPTATRTSTRSPTPTP
jgi:tetratricopeptide (TPR) repeat protein